MRITVEIDDKDLKDLKRFTGSRKKSPAVSAAVEDYLRRRKIEDIIRRVNSGEVDFGLTFEELKKPRPRRPHHHHRHGRSCRSSVRPTA